MGGIQYELKEFCKIISLKQFRKRITASQFRVKQIFTVETGELLDSVKHYKYFGKGNYKWI